MTANSNSADKANMGAVPLSADILVRANIGLWAFELDEGKEPRMYVDDNMLALIGLTEQTTPEKTYHAWYDHIDPDHYDEVSESVEKMTQGIHAEVSYPWHHPTKGVMYVRCGGVRNFAYTDGIRLEGCHQDISMIMHFQKQQAETAQGVKTFSDLFIDQFVSAYYIEIETGSMIIYRQEDHLNKKYGSVINYRESIKKYIAEDVHPEDRGKLLHICDIEYIKKRLRTESQFSVVFRDMSIGSERLLRLQVTRGSDENHVAMGFMDVTENIKNTIKETNEKRTFSDIANALAGRYENVYLIDADDETYQDFNASGKPGNINLKYMESGKLSLEEVNCNLANVMHDLNTIILGQAQAKQQNLYIDSVDIQDEDVVCDMLRLHQVLINLLSNAIKFTPSGGNIYVRVRQTSSEGGIGKYDFVVKDDGIGMSEEFADRIFEPFERERTSTVSKTQGTGLGMSITKTIIDLMGGTIEVHTEQGKGTEFVIHLTLKLQDKNRSIEPISELLGKRVLIIDDDKNSCESASSLISTFGLCTEWTLFGSEALKIAEAAAKASTPFDAYIIDRKMPDTPGFEVIKNLREKFGADIPIIIMSAYDRATIEEEARICGAVEFMSKPLFLSEMYDVLTRVFGCKNDLSSGAEAEEISFAGKKILLVEDNELNREIATEILEERGFIVDTADDGTVAVDKVKAAKAGAYDAILMDIQMPIMDGYEATRQIRESACPLAKIPIIAMTANAFAEDRKAAFEAEMNEHIAKPIDVDKLNGVLKRFLL